MKKFLVTFLVIILVAALCVAGYYIYNLNSKVEEQEKTIKELKDNTTKTEEVKNEVEDENQDEEEPKDEEDDEEDTDENLVKDLVLDEIKLTYGGNNGKLLDYRVDKVVLLTDEQKKNLIKTIDTYKETDILANVTYSLKPKDVNDPAWTVGNGEVKGDWVVNKSACVCVREEMLRGGLSTGW